MSEIIGPQDKEIDGRVYRVTPFLGEKCFLHYAALTKIIGEPLAKGLIMAVSQPSEAVISPTAYLKEGPLDKEVSEYLPAVGEAFGTLTEKLDPQEMLKLMKAFIADSRIIEDGTKERPINFNIDFGGGRMKPLFKLFLFVLEVNFSDFLPDGISLMTVVRDVAGAAG
jgi:hypothetical protein